MTDKTAFVFSYRARPLVLTERGPPHAMDAKSTSVTIFPGPNEVPLSVVETWQRADPTLRFRRMLRFKPSYALE